MSRDEPEWVSYLVAADIIGCHPATIAKLVSAGRIRRRCVNRRFPSLDRQSVEEVGREWRREQAAKRRSAVVRAQRLEERRTPPDDESVWLTAGQSASMLGVTRTRINQLARFERLPSVMRAGRRWFRRQDVEIAAAARAFHDQNH